MKRGLLVGFATLGLLLALALPASAPAQKATGSVVNGTPVDPSSYPYVGFLRVGRSRARLPDVFAAQCGVVLVHPDVALTAGHCVLGFAFHVTETFLPARFLQVVFGKRKLSSRVAGERINVSQVSVPIDFYPRGHGDVAVLRLEHPASVTPATLPGPSDEALGTIGTTINFVGWGDTGKGNPFIERFRSVLRVGGAYIEECRIPKELAKFVGPGVLCSGGTRQLFCYGDSGGPGFVSGPDPARPFVVGIISAGIPGCKPRGSRIYTGLLPQSPYFAFVNERVATVDTTPATVHVDPPLPSPIPPRTGFRVMLRADEPVRAECRIGRRPWFECMQGTTGQFGAASGRERRSYLLRIRAVDQSQNLSYFQHTIQVG